MIRAVVGWAGLIVAEAVRRCHEGDSLAQIPIRMSN